jgi:ubiquinone/menaquinone biosynthesis C-methylase UbiE
LAAVSGFITARFEQLAIRSESAEAVMSVDALQYAANKLATFVEAARTLRPGGRLMFTAFEVDSAAGVPVLGRDPVSDFRPLLEAAGFEVAHYEETADWMRRVTRTYEAVRGALPVLSQQLGSAAATALAVEVSLTLERAMYRRRILAAAVRR